MKKILSLFVVVLLLSTCACSQKVDANVLFDEQVYQWFLEDIQQDYLSAHFAITDLSKYSLETPEVTFGEVQNEDDGSTSARIKTLMKIKRADLSAQRQITYDSALSAYQLQQQYLDLEYYYDVYFSGSSGINNDLIFYFTEFEIRNHQDALDYITLLQDSKRYIEDGLKLVDQQVELGYIQSDSGLDETIESCQRFIEKEENEALVHFKSELDKYNFNDEEALIQQASQDINDYLLAGFQEIIDKYQTFYDLNNEAIGLCYYPGGEEYYEVMLQIKASNTNSAKTISNTLQDGLVEILREMIDSMVEAQEEEFGFSDPYLVYDYIDKYMSDDFPEIENLHYTVDYLDPSSISENTLTYYILSPLDDINNNVIKVNPKVNSDDISYLAKVLCHEGYPDHLYQHNYFYGGDNPNKEFRYCLDFIAYSEGWAMHAMDYCIDYFIADDITVSYEQCSNKYGYVLESYLDILVNYLGYDKSEMKEFLDTIYNEEYAQKLADSIYESLINEPLRLMAYGTGVVQMDDLRDAIKEELQDNYSDLVFNKYVLECGPTTYNILEKYIKTINE